MSLTYFMDGPRAPRSRMAPGSSRSLASGVALGSFGTTRETEAAHSVRVVLSACKAIHDPLLHCHPPSRVQVPPGSPASRCLLGAETLDDPHDPPRAEPGRAVEGPRAERVAGHGGPGNFWPGRPGPAPARAPETFARGARPGNAAPAAWPRPCPGRPAGAGHGALRQGKPARQALLHKPGSARPGVPWLLRWLRWRWLAAGTFCVVLASSRHGGRPARHSAAGWA